MGTCPALRSWFCTSCFHANCVSSPAFPVHQTAQHHWHPQYCPDGAHHPGESHIISLHNLTNFFKMRVKKIFLMMCQTPFRHNRAASGRRCRWFFGLSRAHSAKAPGMEGEVVNALFRLLNQGVTNQLPSQLFRQCLPLSPMPGRLAQCRLAQASCERSTRVSNILPVDKSMMVSAPQRVAHTSLSTSSSYGRSQGRVANVAIDLYRESCATR